jgi:hypothetical protein
MFKTLAFTAITAVMVLAGPQADAAHHHRYHNHGHHIKVVQVDPTPTTENCTTNVLGGPASTCGGASPLTGSSPCAPGVLVCTPPPCSTKTCPNY